MTAFAALTVFGCVTRLLWPRGSVRRDHLEEDPSKEVQPQQTRIEGCGFSGVCGGLWRGTELRGQKAKATGQSVRNHKVDIADKRDLPKDGKVPEEVRRLFPGKQQGERTPQGLGLGRRGGKRAKVTA